MEMLYYTVAAIFLYTASDWILNRLEIRRGKRFDNRSLIFFAIILVLSVALFNLIQYLQSTPEAVSSAAGVQVEPAAVTADSVPGN